MTTKIEESPAVQILREQRDRYKSDFNFGIGCHLAYIADAEAQIEHHRAEVVELERCVASIDAALAALGSD